MKKYYYSTLLAMFSVLFFSCGEDKDSIVEFSTSVTVSAPQMAVSEGAGVATFIVQISDDNTSGSAISIPFTLSGSATASEDYTAPTLVAQIEQNEASATISIEVTDDADVEENETIIFTLGTLPAGVSSTSTEATVIIQDNDSPEFSAIVSMSASQETVTEGDGSVELTVSLDKENVTGGTITIPLEISGTTTDSDFSVSSSEVQITANATSATYVINITDDQEVEQDETIVISFGTLPSALTSSTQNVTITLQDNDQSNTDIELTFGTPSGNAITIDSWTDVGADSYLVVINTENSFSDISDATSQLASTTYIGYGEQVIYSGATISALEVSLLSANTDYYFKVIPKSGSAYDNSQSTENQSTDNCVTTSTTEGQVCFDISSDLRIITSNQLSNHAVGNFPNADPTAIEVTRELDLTPSYTGQAILVYDETGGPTPSNDNFWQFGIATNGVEFHPMGLKPWEHPDTGEQNWEWQAKVTEEDETGLDAYGAHVTSQGNYHYHGDIVGLADQEDGSRHSLIYGFAADGFPIYYKYGYSDPNDPTSSIKELLSSYQLKSGARTGTGIAGEDYPDGDHDGFYIQDFEYVNGLGDLDECNGREGVTPEFPDGTYYYVITADFPVTPNCFFGTPADDWKIGK